MANAATTTYEIPAEISARLAGLRRRLTTWIVTYGVGRVLLFALVVFALDLWIDWYFRLDFAQRSVLGALMLGAIAFAAYRWVIAPLLAAITDDALILEVERKHKELGQSMISAAQFSRLGSTEHMGVSRTMVDATIRHGADAAGRIDFGGVLNLTGWYRNIAILIVGIVFSSLLGVGVAQSEPLKIWFNRNILLGDATWPQETYLEIVGVKDGVIMLPRGENWSQIVKVTEDSKVVPDVVFIDFIPARGRPSQAMKRAVSDKRTFETVFTNVIEEFQFRARAGDAITERVRVRLVEPPALDELALHITLPKYAKSVKETLPSGKGPYFVLTGSEFAIEGTANKALSKAVLVIQPDLTQMRRILAKRLAREKAAAEPVDPAAANSESPPVAPAPAQSGNLEGIEFRQELQLATDTKVSGVVAAWLPESEQVEDEIKQLTKSARFVPGKYMIELTDAGGLTSKRPTTFVITFKDDREPRFSHARLMGVSGMVVPQARIPYSAKVVDDYAVTEARLAYRWRGEESDSATEAGRVELESIAGKLPAASVDIEEEGFELSTLKLAPGSSLTLFLEATDNDDISGPNHGKSPDFLLRVVTEEQLRTDLLRREKEQRQEFERLLKTQEDIITDVAALAAGVAEAKDFTEEQKLQLMSLQKRQNLIGTNTGGVANVFETISIEVVNNRLEDSDGKLLVRLRERIIAPMRRIAGQDADGSVFRAVIGLEKARRVAAQPAERDAALVETQAQQAKIVETMKDVLESMAKAEGYQEAINLLYELQTAQKDVLDRTRKENEDRIKKILEEGGKVPERVKPEEVKPDETKPEEAKPEEPKPDGEKPADPKPAEPE